MTFQTWLLFFITDAALSATPGPAVLFVLSQAISGGSSRSTWASLGILSANAMYFALSATGLGAILTASYNLFFLIKWAGAAYLVYLGLECFFSHSSAWALPEQNLASKASNRRTWIDAFLLEGANPKALLFFTAILPQFIDTTYAVARQVLILGVSSIAVEFFILLTYGHLAGRAVSAWKHTRFQTISNRVAGSLLIGAGLGMARLKRS